MTHPVLAADCVAVVTGAASGIGLAVCKRLASVGMRWHPDYVRDFEAFEP